MRSSFRGKLFLIKHVAIIIIIIIDDNQLNKKHWFKKTRQILRGKIWIWNNFVFIIKHALKCWIKNNAYLKKKH